MKKKICQLTEDVKTPHKPSNESHQLKRLQQELLEKEDELSKTRSNVNILTDSNALLNEKLAHMEKQVQLLSNREIALNENIDKMKQDLEERDKIVDYINNNNKELEECIKDLRSQLNKSGTC